MIESIIEFIEGLGTNTIAIIVALIAAIVALSIHFLQRKNTKKTLLVEKTIAIEREFNEHATLFKQAFSKIMYWLEREAATDNSIHTAGKLKDVSKVFEDAIEKFRAILPGERISSFDRACETFYNKGGDRNQKYYGYASMEPEQAAKEALKNIGALLEFTRP